MSRTAQNILFGINVVAFVASVCWLVYSLAPPISATLRVTELDRHQVIDETAPCAFDPRLAENTRANLGRWIAENEVTVAQETAMALVIITLVNAIALLLFGPHAAVVQGKTNLPPAA